MSRAPQTESAALPPPPSCYPRRTLADIIMEKLTEKQTEVETVMSEVSGFPVPQLDPRVLEVYRGVREVRTERRAMTGHPHQGSGGPISCRPEGRLGDPLPAYDSRLNSALKNEDDTRTSLQDGCED